MGQSSSRSRRPEPPDAPATSSPSSSSSLSAERDTTNGNVNDHHPTAHQIHQSDPPTAPVSSPNNDRLRRSSFRRSVLNLLKPSASRNRAHGTSGHLDTTPRPSKFSTLRALRPRRFSSMPTSESTPMSTRFPRQDQEQPELTSSPSIPPLLETQEALVGADAAEPSSASSSLVPSTDIHTSSSNKGKEPEPTRSQHTAVVQHFRDNQPSSGSSSSTSTPSPDLHRNGSDHQPAINLASTVEQIHELIQVDDWTGNQGAPGVSSMSSDVMLGPQRSGLGIDLDDTSRNITPSGFATEQPFETLQPPIESTSIGAGTLPTSAVQQSNRLSSTPETQPSQPHAQTSPSLAPPVRHVPPPGTLVVVQGVVHTTDVSRPSPSEHANPVSPASAPNASLSSTGNTTSSTAPFTIPMSGPTSHSPISSDRDRDRARNRLSTLFGRSGSRPSSRSSTQVPSVMEGSEPFRNDNGTVHEGGTSTQDRVVNESEAQNNAAASPPTDSSSLLSDSIVTDVTPPSAEVGSRTEDMGPRINTAGPSPQTSERSNNSSLSPSSIDILGTLLSVAAAATAASLLTGSSEPILSSGLAPPAASSTSSSLPAHLSPTSASPSTTIPSYPRPVHPFRPTGINDMSSAGRAERMRQAWSTIRERLGLRPTPPQHNPHFPIPSSRPVSSSSFDSDSGSDSTMRRGSTSTSSTSVGRNQSLMDTREQMLAEMARAFNVGLGLGPNAGSDSGGDDVGIGVEGAESNSDASAGQGGSRHGGEADQEGERREGNGGESLPPEGSFERFLVELQADLRAALSQEGLNGQDGRNSQETERERERGRNHRNETGASAGLASNRPESYNSQVVDNNLNEDEGGNDMPELRSVTDSDSEYNNEGNEGVEDDFSSAATSPLSPPRTSTVSNDEPLRPRPQGPSLGSSINASGSINWWRVYRFPPILPTRPPTSAPTPSTPTSPSSPSTQPLSSEQPDPSFTLPSDQGVESSSRPSNINDNFPGNTGQAENTSANVIIPVIIVGLQSVNNPSWQPTMLTEGLEGGVPGDAGVGEVPFDTGMGVSEGARNRQSRRWSSRATSALRNLRPGSSGIGTGIGNGYDHGTGSRNRGGVEGQQDGGGPGSRTFLIYVIGGYYPPDHNIVTGGPDRLETFEALLELVEFLTNVKSPTATKEEIERSGLEIIKTSQLEQYEQDGKLSSNCIERCLICLDDYEEQDEIRVMACRHGFHKGCVDKWLQTGKNNCPACRSKGVSPTNPTAPTPRSASTS